MMKKIYHISMLGVGLLLCNTFVSAQTGVLDHIKPSDVKLKEVSNTLLVDMKLTVDHLQLGNMERLTVTPRLVGDSGERFDFKSFIVAGKRRQRYDSRSALLDKKPIPVYLNEYTYNERIPFAPWMERASLVLDGKVASCGGRDAGTFNKLVTNTIELEPKLPAHRYVMIPFVNFVAPEVEPIKNRAEVGSAKIEFMVGKSNVLPNFKGNQAELDKINNAIRQVLSDSLAVVNSIMLTSYSSPEGSYLANEKLSTARAAAMKVYIESNNEIRGINVNTSAVAEDWAGVEKMIVNSQLPQQQQLLDIIAKNAKPDRREQLMKALAGGRPWRTMATEWFPQLRRTDYQLNYSVKDFSLEVARNVIKTRPGQLSLNEMFHVANSYEKGSPEFNEVFDIAVRLYPDNSAANINAAALAINRRDSTQAVKYLDRVKDDPQAYNNWGAYYILIGEMEKAREYLGRAPQSIEAVRNNEKELKTKEQDNILFDKYSKQ